jgi:iron complex outermembrane receptor protein
VDLGPRVAVSGSARADVHSEYGTQLSPRLSALWRIGPAWSLRASAGGGYFAPTPFTEEIEVVGVVPLAPLSGVRAERARSGSLDLGGSVGLMEIHGSLFASEITHAVGVTATTSGPAALEIVNAATPTRTHGAELLLRARPGAFHLTASYTWVRAREEDPRSKTRREVPLTPRHALGFVGAYEVEDKGRIGLEVYRTGVQQLADDPYRVESVPYVHVGLMIVRRVGRVQVFLNGENLLDFRQTDYSPLLRPSAQSPGRWTTDVWGPLDGRVFNLGLRFGASR